MQIKKLAFSSLIRFFALPLDKVLSLDNERKTSFPFALSSLNRTFAADYQGVPTCCGLR